MSYCVNCGYRNSDEARFCENCGSPIADASVQAAEVPVQLQPTQPIPTSFPETPSGQPAQPGQPTPPVQPGQPQSSGKAVAALVFGILAIVTSGTVLIGLVLGIVAIILGVSALKETQDGKAKAGKICGIVGVALSVVAIICYVAFGVLVGMMSLGGNIYTDDEAAAIVEKLTQGTSSSSSSAASSSSSSSSAATEAPAKTPDPAPAPAAKDPIVGKWEGTLQSGEPCVYEFRDNGSFLEYVEGEIFNQGLYRSVGNTLILDGDFEEEEWEYSFQENDQKLLLTYPLFDATFIFYRIG